MGATESAMGAVKDVTGTIGAVKDAGSMVKGLTEGEIPGYDQVTGMVEKIPGADKIAETMKTVGSVGKIAADLAQGKPPSPE